MPERGLVFDASAADPADWGEADSLLTDAFLACQEAMRKRRPIVIVVHEPSLYGHTSELRSALATALLGGVRSLAVEGRRDGIPVNAVATGGDGDRLQADETVRWLLEQDRLTGQLIGSGGVHLGRPPA
jgi:hypothetical protein